MSNKIFLKLRDFSGSKKAVQKENGNIYLLFVLFIAGSVIGTFVGTFSSSSAETVERLISGHIDVASTSVLTAFWSCGKFHLFVLICATSVLGIFAVPIFAAVRGYLISCSAAALISCYENGIWIAVVVIGLPGLFSIPSFFMMSSDAVSASYSLLRLSLGSSRSLSIGHPMLRRGIACVFSITIAVLLEVYAVPGILKLITF